MKNAILYVALICFVLISFKTTYAAQPDLKLFKAITKVESNGNPNAVGDGGRAVGIAQIHVGVVIDCNRIAGYKKYSPADRRNPAKSFEMFKTYLKRYVPNGSYERMSRCWNGDFGNINKPCTLGYWKKVQKALK